MKSEVKRPQGGPRRIVYFDLLRAFAPLAVILIHVCPNAAKLGGISSTDTADFVLANTLQLMQRWAVPVFLMMSGALFLNPKKPFSYKKHFKKYVWRLVLVYIFWSFIYAAVSALIHFGPGEGRLAFFLRLFCGTHYYHLWYLIALVMMYLLVPILRKVTEDRRLLNYYLIIGIVICFAMPMIGELCEIILAGVKGLNPAIVGAMKGVMDMTEYSAGKLCLYFAVYFVLGYFLHTERLTKFTRVTLYVLGAMALVDAILLSQIKFRLLGHSWSGASEENINILALTYSVAIFVGAKYALRKTRDLPKWIKSMAKYSFGIYLCHALFVDYVMYYPKRPSIIPVGHRKLELLLYLGASLAIYMACFCITWAMSRIPVLKKFV